MKKLIIKLDDEVHQKFKLFCVERLYSMQDVVAGMIMKIMKEQKRYFRDFKIREYLDV